MLPVECETHNCYEEDHKHDAGTNDDGEADHDSSVLQLLLSHGGDQDPVTVTRDYQAVGLQVGNISYGK